MAVFGIKVEIDLGDTSRSTQGIRTHQTSRNAEGGITHVGAHASATNRMLKHDLWKDIGGEQYSEYTFCLAGPQGDDARRSLSPAAQLIWTVEADSHFAAMTAYYKFMDWGTYTADQEWDMRPYPKEWSQT